MSENSQPRNERIALTPEERRVLGVLIEKALSTPDYYPMTLKAIVAGCNQRSNRDPIMNLDEEAVRRALSLLQQDHFLLAVKGDTGWATRYRHQLDRRLNTQVKEEAVLAELLLRGVQTEGELRTHASRMRPFEDLQMVQETIQRMREWTPPLVTRLSPEGIVRGVRYAHLLYLEDEMAAVLAQGSAPVAFMASGETTSPHGAHRGPLEVRIATLEDRVQRLESFLSKELGASFPADPAE